MAKEIVKSSFRDPSGFLFFKEGKIYRQINYNYKDNYDQLINSGLYQRLVDDNLLIPHKEVEAPKTDINCYKVIEPDMIDFISYPYEWSFSQLKDAALTTLKIQKTAVEFGMCLKDSSAYNIQFKVGKPVLIDTLSFEKYVEGSTWIAYRQFCQHFFAPLVLMSYKDIRLSNLLRIFIDGIPLDLASSLLPIKTYFKFSVLTNIHLHAKSQKKHESDAEIENSVNMRQYKMSRANYLALVESLESTVKGLKWQPQGTEWGDYYDITNYSDAAFEHKKEFVGKFVEKIKPETVWDLGANNGVFSRIASDRGIKTVAFDIDPVAVEKSYLYSVKNQEESILPLVLDLTNPSPSIGWDNEERMSIKQRKLPDMVFALALIHHLAISNNVPLSKIAAYFNDICSSLIIEFVPKNDSQVKKLLASREDIFGNYNQEAFENEFAKYFKILSSERIKSSERTLYLMSRK